MPWDPHAEYLAGLVGCYTDKEASDRFDALIELQGQSPDGGATCARYGLSGTGAGGLWAPFHVIEIVFPGSLPAAAQKVGSCVAHSTRNAILGTLACEIYAGKPDEVTGLIEGAPELADAARRDGVLSTEGIYWWRGHGRKDGWICEEAAEVACTKSGAWLRKNYPELGIDLTTYNVDNEIKWGQPTPPENVAKIGREHLVRTATRAKTFEQLRDLIANGYCASTCGMESWSNQRDDNGVSSRTLQGWAHAMACLGVDDRDEIKKRYGEPLVLVANSWARWNSGGRRVLGTSLDIPDGSFWSRWSDFKNRSIICFSSVNGWPAQRLPNWTGGSL